MFKLLLLFVSAILVSFYSLPTYAALDYGKQTLIGADFSKTDLISIQYGECMQAAQLRNEIILGLQFYEEQKNKENMFGIKLIPDKSEVFTISSKDGFVSLAQDEG